MFAAHLVELRGGSVKAGWTAAVGRDQTEQQEIFDLRQTSVIVVGGIQPPVF